jgi:L-fuculose-phosphate aldolase
MANISKEAIAEILFVAKRLDEKNLVNAYEGNISLKLDGLIYITPTSKNKGTLTEDMIAVIDGECRQIAGNCKPTSELIMHFDAYKIRSSIGGVVHCHAPYMTAYALCGKPVEAPCYPEMMGNFGSIEVAAYGRPGTDQILKGAIPVLKHKPIVLLANHGALAVGPTATDAMNTTEACEAITRVVMLAERMGSPVALPEDECGHFLSIQKAKFGH